ncbi:MAG: hypothetical protein JO332_12910 [Planctomycetaceae bacterium]|nr:hypothetical protein [Planctomycetaceae bacterium]
MTSPRLRGVLTILLPLSLGGCQLLGAGGSMVAGLLQFALYLAAIAAPILLSYYLYKRSHD